MQKITLFSVLLISFILLNTSTLYSQEEGKKFSWPLEIESDGGFVTTLYQPQLESFKSNILEGRMAVTIKPKDKEMIFGAVWFKARLSSDMDERTVLLEEMNIIKTHFPEMVNEDNVKKFSDLLTVEIESWNLEMSLDRILASLDEVENMNDLSHQIKNDPPEIYFRNEAAVLVMIDGEPILKEDDDSGLEYVVNTTFFIVKDSKSNKFYINGGPFWYSSTDILKAYEETKSVPNKIEKFAKKYQEDKAVDSVAESYDKAPELILSTKAAELIMVDGDIDYKPIDSTSLLFVSNTESDIIMDINSQNHYVLLAGRWYYSKTLKDGDWKFCEPDKLPAEFKIIPQKSEMAAVRSSIPGTDEAETALLEQSIPQTATIDRKTASVEVKYDGEPKFEKVEGTDVSYAVNTDKTVLLIKKVYYVVEDAVWFSSAKATGPWEVSTVKPSEVDDLPPESAVYNVKYTYIYETTPEVVYVGYLPGYTYSYVYGGVVVYGTGYYYNPWYSHYYYPRPVTWGYGVHYNPYSGWGFSFGVSYGWIGWGFHPYRRAYWGPRGYHAGYRHGYNRGYAHGARAGYAAGQRHSNNNVYKNRSNGVVKTGNVRNGANTRDVNSKARPSNKANNMYTDKSGNVYQRKNNGSYENKTNGRGNASQRPSNGQQTRPSGNKPQQKPAVERPQQKPTTQQRPSTQQQTRPQQKPSNTQSRPQTNNKQSLDRSYQNRNQGTQNYNRSRSSGYSGGASRSGGVASRGGGGRRR